MADPNSLEGNCGPGYQQRPAWQTLRLTPLPRSAQNGAHLAAAAQQHTDRSLLDRLLGANSWDQVRHYAELLLGTQCFELGVCYGIVKNLAQSVWALVQLLKTLVLAALYIRATHRPEGWDLLAWSDYWEAREVQHLAGQQMKEAYEDVQKIKAQMAGIMHDPLGFFRSIRAQFKTEYIGKWSRFKPLETDSSLRHQFEAGEIFGEVVAEVVLTILAVIDGAGVLVKLSSKIPELLSIVRTVRTAEAASKAEGVAEAARVGKEFDNAVTPKQLSQDALKASTVSLKQEIEASLSELRGKARQTGVVDPGLRSQIKTDLLTEIDALDLSTPKDEAAFWSGGDVARQAAEKSGLSNLERTTGGSWLDGLHIWDKDALGGSDAYDVFTKASSKFGQSASGEVNVFLNNPRPNSIYYEFEKSALENNPSVTQIIEHDLTKGSQ